jgi:hypothetical protein
MKFGHHSLNVLEALGTKIKTLNIIVFLNITIWCMPPEKTRTSLEVMIVPA